jgi:hypothetical protein
MIAQKIGSLIKSRTDGKAVCLIIPTQLQLNDSLFRRFKSNYTGSNYIRWKEKVTGVSEMMTAIGNYIAVFLHKNEIPVINLQDVFLKNDVSKMFQPLNNHLSRYGHQVICDTLYKYFTQKEVYDKRNI